MQIELGRKDVYFLLFCLGLGILAELSFFHGQIGISYPLFILVFYTVLFLRIRLDFQHRRIGLLLMLAIWIMAGTFAIYDYSFLHALNVLVIPALVFIHVVLITSPNELQWASLQFYKRLKRKLAEGLQYSAAFSKKITSRFTGNLSEQTARMLTRVLLGIILGLPMLFIVTLLLISADEAFGDLMMHLPRFLSTLNFLEGFFRTLLVVFLTLLFFGILQVISRRSAQSSPSSESDQDSFIKLRFDSVTALTILVMLNGVYVLFAAIQFQYLFSDRLLDGLTFAEYARRGFFELLFVTMINWSVLFTFLRTVKASGNSMRLTLKIMYSLLVAVSGVMLVSAFIRLLMYEAAYGFTVDRVLAHAFMIFLIVIFAYTLIHVWLERLRLLHFYMIAALLFYTVLNVVNIEQIVVERNLERYEATGKIDLGYLNSLSYSGVNGLIELYEEGMADAELIQILKDRKQQVMAERQRGWQSFNFAEEKVRERLKSLDVQ